MTQKQLTTTEFCGMCCSQPCNCPDMPMPTNRATPPVVPQGEWVFLSYDDPLISETIKNDPLYIRGYESAIEATKEKAAKLCDGMSDLAERQELKPRASFYRQCAAAIRSMK